MIRRLTLIGAVLGMLGPTTSAAAQIAPIDTAKINEIFAPMANRQSPGCAVGTMRDGKIEFARGYGMADIEHGTPITTKTPMNLGSVTKQFTAAAVNLLAARGQAVARR
jgi:CubicO group peptidase (beta-lactamase class C family)